MKVSLPKERIQEADLIEELKQNKAKIEGIHSHLKDVREGIAAAKDALLQKEDEIARRERRFRDEEKEKSRILAEKEHEIRNLTLALKNQSAILEARQRDIQQKEEIVKYKESKADKLNDTIRIKESQITELTLKEEHLRRKEKELKELEEFLNRRKHDLESEDKELAIEREKHLILIERDRKLEQRHKEFDKRSKELEESYAKLKARENDVSDKEIKAKKVLRDKELDSYIKSKEAEYQYRLAEIAKKELDLQNISKDLNFREKELNERQSRIFEKATGLKSKEGEITELLRRVNEKDELVSNNLRFFKEKEEILRAKENELKKKETDIQKAEHDIGRKVQSIKERESESRRTNEILEMRLRTLSDEQKKLEETRNKILARSHELNEKIIAFDNRVSKEKEEIEWNKKEIAKRKNQLVKDAQLLRAKISEVLEREEAVLLKEVQKHFGNIQAAEKHLADKREMVLRYYRELDIKSRDFFDQINTKKSELLLEKDRVNDLKKKIEKETTDLQALLKKTKKEKDELDYLKDKELELRAKEKDLVKINLRIDNNLPVLEAMKDELKLKIPEHKIKNEQYLKNVDCLQKKWDLKLKDLSTAEDTLSKFTSEFLPQITEVKRNLDLLGDKSDEIQKLHDEIIRERHSLDRERKELDQRYNKLANIEFRLKGEQEKRSSLSHAIKEEGEKLQAELKSVRSAAEAKKKLTSVRHALGKIAEKIEKHDEESLARYILLNDKEKELAMKERELAVAKEKMLLYVSRLEAKRIALDKLKEEKIFEMINESPQGDISENITNISDATDPKKVLRELLSTVRQLIKNSQTDKAAQILKKIEDEFKTLDRSDLPDISYEILELKTDIKLANL